MKQVWVRTVPEALDDKGELLANRTTITLEYNLIGRVVMRREQMERILMEARYTLEEFE